MKMLVEQNDCRSGGWRQDSLPALVREMDFSTSESEEEAEMKEYEDEGEEEEGEEEEEEEEEEKAMVGSEEEGSDYPSDLDPDELVESIEEDDIDLSGRVMLFHLAYPDGYPYCVESLAFEWTEVAAHLTVEKIREYDCHAFWKDTTLVELDGRTRLQHNLTEGVFRPESMPDAAKKSWCCGRRFCWGHGRNVEWI